MQNSFSFHFQHRVPYLPTAPVSLCLPQCFTLGFLLLGTILFSQLHQPKITTITLCPWLSPEPFSSIHLQTLTPFSCALPSPSFAQTSLHLLPLQAKPKPSPALFFFSVLHGAPSTRHHHQQFGFWSSSSSCPASPPSSAWLCCCCSPFSWRDPGCEHRLCSCSKSFLVKLGATGGCFPCSFLVRLRLLVAVDLTASNCQVPSLRSASFFPRLVTFPFCCLAC